MWQSPTPLEAVVREVREVREVVESALRQLQALSQSVQRLVHQFCQVQPSPSLLVGMATLSLSQVTQKPVKPVPSQFPGDRGD